MAVSVHRAEIDHELIARLHLDATDLDVAQHLTAHGHRSLDAKHLLDHLW